MYNVAYFREFQKMYLRKDIFLLPYYIAKCMEIPLYYYYAYDSGGVAWEEKERGVTFYNFNHDKSNELLRLWDLCRCAIIPARKINVLFLVHTSLSNMITTILFKKINPKGKVIIMGDLDEKLAQNLSEHNYVYSKGIKGWVKKKIVDSFFKNLDVLTVETNKVFSIFQKMSHRNGWKGIVQCYPCLDEELFNQLALTRKSFDEKENIMITVGRIGSYQKNTDMILNALSKVDLKDWKFYFIGPLTDSFNTSSESNYKKHIRQFYSENPLLEGRVIFTGPIYDPKEIYEYYLRAKVFVLTSRYEGFANVLSEAAALGCYIVSTDVGGASLVSNDWQFGTKIEQEDIEGLAEIFQSIIAGAMIMNSTKQKPYNELLWGKMVRKNLIPLLKTQFDIL